jgi:hypothetical protein
MYRPEDARKKLLTLSLRRKAVIWAVQDKGYSQRRACGLVGPHAIEKLAGLSDRLQRFVVERHVDIETAPNP